MRSERAGIDADAVNENRRLVNCLLNIILCVSINSRSHQLDRSFPKTHYVKNQSYFLIDAHFAIERNSSVRD